jgi:hypothetical protein
MPNIIEQQDLLKGLPDDRLSMLMQNPVGDIPPFLVAAEAQRRQSIREQFAGGPQESVVDTLTKQLSNVPQNIQAPAQQPPQMPPPQMQQQMPQMQQPEMPPEQGGIDTLQQSMRDGGMVRRFASEGYVAPTFRGRAGAGNYYAGEVPDQGLISRVIDYVGENTGPFFENIGKYGINPTPEQRAQIKDEAEVSAQTSEPYRYGMTTEERQTMQRAPQTASPVIPPNPDVGKEGTSTQNKNAVSLDEYRKSLEAIYGNSEEDSAYVRQKLEELYGNNDISSWEKAQKWFAAAQAAVQPDQTNMQAAINALSALGGGFAQERASERENQQAMAEALLRYELADRDAARQGQSEIEKGMLEYRLDEQQRAAQAEASRAERERDAYKFYAEKAGSRFDVAGDLLSNLERRKIEYIKSLPEALPGQPGPDLTNDPYIAALDKQIEEVRQMIMGAEGAMQGALLKYGEATGTDPSITMFTPDGRLVNVNK